jgi:hypothetical protein
MTALLTYSQWVTTEPSVAIGACNGFSMTAWVQRRARPCESRLAGGRMAKRQQPAKRTKRPVKGLPLDGRCGCYTSQKKGTE